MNNDSAIVNKVQSSGIVTLDLSDFLSGINLSDIEISQWFWQGLALREKEFRAHLDHHDWDAYVGKAVCLWSSVDAIIPHWAWMLVTSRLSGIAYQVHVCTPNEHPVRLIESAVYAINPQDYADARVVIKGCGELELPAHVYSAITAKLQPVVKSLMFGEPCSTVPVWKRK